MAAMAGTDPLGLELVAGLGARLPVVVHDGVGRARRLAPARPSFPVGLDAAAQTTEEERQRERGDDDQEQQENCDSAFHGLWGNQYGRATIAVSGRALDAVSRMGEPG